jgi:hypothetical protein
MSMDKKHCAGCRDDFYNGNNPYGIKECWMLKSAKLILRKEVHINQVPPWNQAPKKLPSCYRKPQFVYVGPEAKS